MDQLIPLNNHSLPGGEATIPAVLTEAAADHLAAWSTNMRLRSAHESAHLLVAVSRGLRVKDVDIRGQGYAYTHVAGADDDQPEVETASRQFSRIVTHLAGFAIEELLIGEATTSCQRDISNATEIAIERFSCGLDPDAPFVSLDSFDRTPESLSEELAASVLRTLEKARVEARADVAKHREAILAFATKLFAVRRLSDDALLAAIREVGIEVARIPEE